MMRLHDYWRSSASYRVRIALGLAGLDWQARPVDLLAGDQTAPAYLRLNPQGLVPALEADGHVLTQSLAIVEYLDEVHGLGLLPGDAADRARVRALAYAVAMEIHPVCNTRVARFATEMSGGAIAMEGWMQRWIGPGLAALEEMLEGGEHCWGEAVTLADICLVPQLYNARRWGVALDGLPKIVRIDAHLARIPAFAAAHPDRVRPDEG